MASSFPATGVLDLAAPGLRHGGYRSAGASNSSDLGSRAHKAILRLASLAPEAIRDAQFADVERMVFHVEKSFVPGGAIADLGGGLGLFAPACAALGMEAFLVDDFGDPVNAELAIEEMPAHRETGVHLVKTDVNHWGEYFDDESLDIVTSFDSIEHWHHSPRRAFQEAYRVLRPGGAVFIGAPNAVNLRKRITVPLGRSNWSGFEDWYYPEHFRGHVREPVLADLVRMVDDLGFELQNVWGRNWAAYAGASGGVRGMLKRMIDLTLRARPTLCSDLYVMAVKPE